MLEPFKIRNRVILALLLLLLSFSQTALSQDNPAANIQGFVSQLKNALEAQDIQNYLDCFSPNMRELERNRFEQKFRDLQMDSATVFLPSVEKRSEDKAIVFLRIFFQNPVKVIIETWQLEAKRLADRWQIVDSTMASETKTLYKVVIPSENMRRVKKFEVQHEDIAIIFEDAVCFFDNIPGIDTALIVLGKGELNFTPSHPRERHQLELVYKKTHVKDKLSYVYLRFSNYFYQNSVNITEYESDPPPVSQGEINWAYSLFIKHYPRSFTVQNSVDGELFSFLPQGDEVVIEFKGDRLGDTTYVYSPFAEDEINLYQWKEERILNLYSPLLEEGEKRMYISLSQKFDVKNYEIDLNFDPSRYYFSGKAKIEIEANVGPLDGIRFKLDPNFSILKILDGNNHDLYYTQDKLRKMVYVYFLRRPSQGQTSTVEIYYRGQMEPPSRIPDVVQFNLIESGRRSYPVQFETYLYSGSSYWYPAPADVEYFTANLKLRIPPKYQVVACGKLTEHHTGAPSEDKEGITDSSVHVFDIKKPVKYLSFIAGKLELVQEDSGAIPIQLFKSDYSRSERWDIFTTAKDILQFYEKIFGPFPYEKLNIVKRVWETSGGHSPASFIVLNELPRLTRQSVREAPNSPVNLSRWAEYFLAHEIAHQWWGQALGWRSYEDQWLSEGVAQFGTILYLKEKYGENVLSQILKDFSKDIQKKSKWGGITMGSRISYLSFDAYQSIVYNKSALVLNMLKDLLGEEIFFSGIKKFFEQFKFTAVNSRSFFQTMQDLSGRDLDLFFDKWFNSHELPDVRCYSKVESEGEGFRFDLRIMQLKERFVFPLWIEWMEGEEKVRKKVLIESQIANFEFRLDDEPRDIRVNPDRAVPGVFKVQ